MRVETTMSSDFPNLEEVLSLPCLKKNKSKGKTFILIPKRPPSETLDPVPIIWHIAAEHSIQGIFFSSRDLWVNETETQGNLYRRLLDAGIATCGKQVEDPDNKSYHSLISPSPHTKPADPHFPAEVVMVYRDGGSFQSSSYDFHETLEVPDVKEYIVNYQCGYLITDLYRRAVWIPSQTSQSVSSNIAAKPFPEVTLSRTIGSETHWMKFQIKPEHYLYVVHAHALWTFP